MSEKISVIIPVYNVEKELPKCMETVLAQTYQNLQILLIDDGSTDHSPALCDSYAAQDARVQVLHQKNSGVSSARNVGLDHASGEYVCFLDSDDYVEPQWVEVLYQGIKGVELSICGFYEVYPEKKVVRTSGKIQHLNQESALRMLLEEEGYRGYLWNKLFCTELLQQHHIRFEGDLSLWEDVLFDFTYLAHCTHVCYNPAPCYDYVFHEQSLSHGTISITKSYDAIRAIERMQMQPQAECAAVQSQIQTRLLTCALSVLRAYALQKNRTNVPQEVEHSVAILRRYRSRTLSRSDRLSVLLCRIHPSLFYWMYRIKNKK